MPKFQPSAPKRTKAKHRPAIGRVVIEVLTNTRCRVRGLDTKTTNLIDDALAMEIPGSHFVEGVQHGAWDGRRHLFYVPTCTFPKGLKKRVKDLLTEAGVPFKMRDLREKVLPPAKLDRLKPGMLKGVSFDKNNPDGIDYSYQLRAVRKALKRGHGILWLATNAGKTECAAAIIKTLSEHRCLFLVHKKALLAQTRKRLAARFGTVEQNIGIIGEGRFEPKHITVATIQTLTRKTTKQKKAIIAKYLKSIELLLVDEGHHTKATTWYRLINRIQAQYRYILSGTPFGSGNGLMVEAAVGPVVAKISNNKLIKLGVSARPVITMHSVDEPQVESGSWDEVYKNGIVLNVKRNEMVVSSAVDYVKRGLPTLILVKEIWHGELISEMLRALKQKHAFVHGSMSMDAIETQKQRFESGKNDILVASPIFDEGVDVPAIRGLIIADGGKSVRSALQKIGRGLRKKKGSNALEVTDFADCTHKWLAKHSMERLSIYEAEGFEVRGV
jgi:superfamily II DNA or RNA helicase